MNQSLKTNTELTTLPKFLPGWSIHLVVRAHSFEQDGFLLRRAHELEDDAQIVAGGAGPRFRELTPQFVGAQRRVMRILGKQFQGGFQVFSRLRMSRRQPPRRAQERLGGQQGSLHALISLAIDAALAALTRPWANSARAS
ncbi:MAG: hypothetical protein ACREF9_08010, partial [Opitutaceae bacterium]